MSEICTKKRKNLPSHRWPRPKIEIMNRIAFAVTDSALLNSESSIEHALLWMKRYFVRGHDEIVLIYVSNILNIQQRKALDIRKSAHLSVWQLLLKYKIRCDNLGMKVLGYPITISCAFLTKLIVWTTYICRQVRYLQEVTALPSWKLLLQASASSLWFAAGDRDYPVCSKPVEFYV